MDLNGDGTLAGIELFISYLLGASAVVIAVRVIGTKFLMPMFKNTRSMIRRTNMFLDDWYGDERTPGVMARIGSLEVELEKVRNQVFNELNRNGGSSTKDAAFEALRTVKEVQLQQEQEIQERKYLTAQLERILDVHFEVEKPEL